MIATVSKRFTFDAAHRLDRLPPDHKCHRMHGHTYEVELSFTGELDQDGFVIDYAEIAKMWQPLHHVLDHHTLNEVPGLELPSTEHLAAWIIANLLATLPDGKRSLLSVVRVKESSTTWCAMWVADLSADDLARYTRADLLSYKLGPVA
jgi:6-pyruvoyltetrahydropterin/6-carboxytetrahydropterin synthase